jgi:hypothetical protein
MHLEIKRGYGESSPSRSRSHVLTLSLHLQEGDEEKINHRIPHRFQPFSNLSASWCCHCGYMLPFGKKNARKCSECSLTCHAACVHLVPDFCGMTMEMANILLTQLRDIKTTQVTRKPVAKILPSPPASTPTSTTPTPSGTVSYVACSGSKTTARCIRRSCSRRTAVRCPAGPNQHRCPAWGSSTVTG